MSTLKQIEASAKQARPVSRETEQTMHAYTISPAIRERVIRRRGRLFAHEELEPRRTALVVVDMQNYFVAEGFPSYVPAAKLIVPNINRMARTLRDAGGLVVWVQTTARGALEHWANHHRYMLTPAAVEKRLEHLAEDSKGFELYPGLEALPEDERVKKIKYSAFTQGSSNLDALLRARRIETLLVAGTATNVCCDSTARDAMLLDYRAVMLADANATWSDEEHRSSLDNFFLFFGDVMTVDEAIDRLRTTA